jgi:uncharacterized protein YjiS (DUF1127 family)
MTARVTSFCLALTLTAVAVASQKPQDETATPSKDKSAGLPVGFAPSATNEVDSTSDPAFDRYVDMTRLRTALRELDSTTLADLGLKLSEGERILFRSHKAMTSEQILGLAVKVAGEQKDHSTLTRIGKAIEGKEQYKALAAKLNLARKLGYEARGGESVPALVSVEEATPEEFAIYREMLRKIKVASLAGDKDSLDDLGQLVPNLFVLKGAQRDHLNGRVAAAKSSLDQGADPAAKALSKLGDPSRDGPFFSEITGTWGGVFKGNKVIVVFRPGDQINEVGSVIGDLFGIGPDKFRYIYRDNGNRGALAIILSNGTRIGDLSVTYPVPGKMTWAFQGEFFTFTRF